LFWLDLIGIKEGASDSNRWLLKHLEVGGPLLDNWRFDLARESISKWAAVLFTACHNRLAALSLGLTWRRFSAVSGALEVSNET